MRSSSITDRRAPPLKRRTGSLLGWLIVPLLIALAARLSLRTLDRHQRLARPDPAAGSTTDWSAYGPRGEQKHCHRYYDGDQPYSKLSLIT
jgi:hypothetical protein